MKRRDFLGAVLGAAVARPLAALGQARAKSPRLGWLFPGTPASVAPWVEIFRQSLAELGYVVDRDVEIEYLYANGELERLPALAARLVARPVDILLTTSTPGAMAAKQATAAAPIPVVFAGSSDALSTGLVVSLARPGGNLTGTSLMSADLSAKRLGLMQMLVPRVSRIAVLWDPSNAGMALRVRETQAAAEQLKIEFYDAGATDLPGLEVSFAQLSSLRPEALVVTAEPFTTRYRERILAFMAEHRIPAMYESDLYVKAGGLMSYGPNIDGLYRRAAAYVDKILKGAKPGDIPVEQPTKFDLAINLKTAKATVIEIPPGLLALADEVIE